MPCLQDRPCGNSLRFILRRPDGVEIYQCLNAHTFRIGTPIPPPARETIYSERVCAAGTRCEGEGFVEAGRYAAYCLPCQAVAPVKSDSASWPPRVPTCRPCRESRFGPCVRHGGPSHAERSLRKYYQEVGRPFPSDVACGACTLSQRNGNGPCANHGGLSKAQRQRQQRAERKHAGRARRRGQAIVVRRPSIIRPHFEAAYA